ncbi:MAG TPA: DUF3617 family protein [Vicinamibacterales bacterium]|nr:DUF3617 family protein [Vicinamibacterales bacterium]
MGATVKTGISVVALMALTCVPGEAQVSLRPGLYERVLEVDADGSTGKTKDTICWSPEDAKDVVKTIATAGKETDCKVSDVKTAPGKLTFNVSCKEAKGVTTTANDVTYGPDFYTNVSKGKSEGGPISQKVSAKRIGECKK